MDKLRIHLGVENEKGSFNVVCKVDYANSDHIMECINFQLEIDNGTNEIFLSKTTEKILLENMKANYVELIREKLKLNREMISNEIKRFNQLILQTTMTVTV